MSIASNKVMKVSLFKLKATTLELIEFDYKWLSLVKHVKAFRDHN